MVTALGHGLLWAVLMPTATGLARSFSYLRVERLPTLAEWSRFAADQRTWRVAT